MSDKLFWSLNTGSPGGGVADSGSLEVEAVTSASVTVDAGATMELAFQLEDVTKIGMLLVKGSTYGGTLRVSAGGSEVVLTGPLILYGDAIALFSDSLGTVTVANDAVDSADVDVLLGLKLTA